MVFATSGGLGGGLGTQPALPNPLPSPDPLNSQKLEGPAEPFFFKP